MTGIAYQTADVDGSRSSIARPARGRAEAAAAARLSERGPHVPGSHPAAGGSLSPHCAGPARLRPSDMPGRGFTSSTISPRPSTASPKSSASIVSRSNFRLRRADRFRLALEHPERITAIISQNGNAYEEGLSDGWNPIRAYWQDRRRPTATHCARSSRRRRPSGNIRTASDATAVSPDGYSLDNFYLARPGADEIQLDSSATTRATSRSTRPSRIFPEAQAAAFWPCGARTTRSSCRRARRRSSATFPTRTCAFSTRVTSRSRRTHRDRRRHPGLPGPLMPSALKDISDVEVGRHRHRGEPRHRAADRHPPCTARAG